MRRVIVICMMLITIISFASTAIAGKQGKFLTPLYEDIFVIKESDIRVAEISEVKQENIVKKAEVMQGKSLTPFHDKIFAIKDGDIRVVQVFMGIETPKNPVTRVKASKVIKKKTIKKFKRTIIKTPTGPWVLKQWNKNPYSKKPLTTAQIIKGIKKFKNLANEDKRLLIVSVIEGKGKKFGWVTISPGDTRKEMLSSKGVMGTDRGVFIGSKEGVAIAARRYSVQKNDGQILFVDIPLFCNNITWDYIKSPFSSIVAILPEDKKPFVDESTHAHVPLDITTDKTLSSQPIPGQSLKQTGRKVGFQHKTYDFETGSWLIIPVCSSVYGYGQHTSDITSLDQVSSSSVRVTTFYKSGQSLDCK